ncbi:MAG: hypothetical protein DRO11_06870 [Methanobacteriota archaeon]|nr:MAG: hypothetical protein DRO11_06870 [Euryarchaeota archaeon]
MQRRAPRSQPSYILFPGSGLPRVFVPLTVKTLICYKPFFPGFSLFFTATSKKSVENLVFGLLAVSLLAALRVGGEHLEGVMAQQPFARERYTWRAAAFWFQAFLDWGSRFGGLDLWLEAGVWFVVEVSSTIDEHGVERAARRAKLLGKTGFECVFCCG